MKTLSRKISSPIIALFIIVPIFIMIIFNGSARYYVNRATADELKNVVENIKGLSETILQKDLIESADGISDENLKRLILIRAALQVSKYSMHTEMVIMNRKGKVIFPQSYEDSFLDETLINKALLKADIEKKLISFVSGGRSYMFIYQDVDGEVRDYKVFFIASATSSNALIRFMNLVLVIVLVVSTGLAIIITLTLSKKISSPLVNAAMITHKVSQGEFVLLQDASDCVEVHALIQGMNAMSQKLKTTEEAQRDFLQNASHELRTPLMSIQGYAEGLSKGVFSQTKETADLIAQESRRLNALVEELLTLSRIESGNYAPVNEHFNLCNAMKDLIQKANGYAVMQEKEIVLIIDKEPLMVMVDEDLLFKAVYNVLTNAVKYAKSKVTVILTIEHNKAVVLIHDDGEGIALKDLPHVFKRFYKGKQGNFGLGLAIAKSSVDLLNGTISVENKDGAQFKISLPLQ